MVEWDVALIRSPRTEPLLAGAVSIGSVHARWLTPPINEMFTRMLRGGDFAVSEMSLTYAMLALDLGAPPLVTLPIFVDRTFRQRDIYVRSDGPIQQPADLVGRTFGLPDFYSADALWIRGMLRQGYGVEPKDVRWEQFRLGKRLDTLPEVDYQLIDEAGTNPEERLRTGRVDAFFAPTTPAAFREGQPWIRKLFIDPEPEEQAYFLHTGIFPIMHTVVMRKDLYEAEPRKAVEVYEGFLKARDSWAAGAAELPSGGSGSASSPAPPQSWEDAAPDMWPYGVARNRLVLESAIGYALADGLIPRPYRPEELFVVELRET